MSRCYHYVQSLQETVKEVEEEKRSIFSQYFGFTNWGRFGRVAGLVGDLEETEKVQRDMEVQKQFPVFGFFMKTTVRSLSTSGRENLKRWSE